MKVKGAIPTYKSAAFVEDDLSDSDSDSGSSSRKGSDKNTNKDNTTNRIVKKKPAETMKVKGAIPTFKSAASDSGSRKGSDKNTNKDKTTNRIVKKNPAETKKVKGVSFKSAATVEDDLSDSDSGPDSEAGSGESSNNNNNKTDNNTDDDNETNSFECPPGFKQVEISTEAEPIYLDDMQGSTELWLIKTPHDFNAKRLNGVNVSLSGRQFLDEDGDSEISYELHASKNMASDMRLPHLLLPSQRGERAKLVPAPAFTGSLAVMETVAIPPVLLPPSPPKRSNELPPGLKQRFRPFGWEDPKKCALRTKKSTDLADSSVQKIKKKKSHKHKQTQEETASPHDEDLDGRHGDDKGAEERLPSGMGEEERGDDDEGVTEGKKKHRRSKKRKHQQREDFEVEKTPEETPKKKKKKKHKDMTE